MRALRPRRLRALQPVRTLQPVRGGLRAVRPLQSLRALQSVRALQPVRTLQPLRGRVAAGERAGRRDRFAAPASPLNAAAAASMVARVA